MPDIQNQLYLSAAGKTYNTVLLDRRVALPPADREAFLDIPEGAEPLRARVWMTASQFNALPTPILQGVTPVALNFIGNAFPWPPGSNPQIAKQTLSTAEMFFIVGAMIARLGVNDAVAEVLLVSQHYWWEWGQFNKAYNVLSADKKTFVGGAVSSSSPTTYTTIVSDLTGALGITATLPISVAEGGPNNFVIGNTPAHRALNRLLRPLAMRLVTNPWGASPSYSIVQFDNTDPPNVAGKSDAANLNSLMAVCGIEGQSVNITDNLSGYWSQIAATINVVCPTTNYTDSYAVASTSNPKYNSIVSTSTGFGKPGTTETLFLGSHFFDSGLGGGSVGESLTAIANERASRFMARALINPTISIFAGGYPIVPTKTIRRVRIGIDMDGWYTTVWRHGLYDNPREDWESRFRSNKAPYFPEHGDTDLSNTLPRDDGTIDIEGFGQGALIPVTLSNGSGSQGDNTTPAAAARLYDARDANTGTLVGTGLSVWQARQKGHITDATKGFVVKISGTKYIVVPDEVIDATVCSGSTGATATLSPGWMGL